MLTIDQFQHIVNCLEYSRQAFNKEQWERAFIGDSTDRDMYLENVQRALNQDVEIIQALKKIVDSQK